MRDRIFGQSMPSPYFFFNVQFVRITAAFLVFVLVGSGTTYAAQGALPGDLLYPVKISLNENVELALATSDEAKIQTEVRLAERRVAEAQALDEKGRLDATTTLEIEQEFDRHASRALALANAERVEAEVEIEHESEDSTSTEGHTSKDSLQSTQMTMSLKVAESMPVSSTTAAATTTTTTPTTTEKNRSNQKGRDIRESLEEQKNRLKELRERVLRRIQENKDIKFDSHDHDHDDDEFGEEDEDDGNTGDSGEKEDKEGEEDGHEDENRHNGSTSPDLRVKIKLQ
jgi:hypothetical protein